MTKTPIINRVIGEYRVKFYIIILSVFILACHFKNIWSKLKNKKFLTGSQPG